MGRQRQSLVLVSAILLSALLGSVSGQGLKTGVLRPSRPQPDVAYYELTVTLARGSPSCGPARDIILVNGLFQPTLTVNVNETLVVSIFSSRGGRCASQARAPMAAAPDVPFMSAAAASHTKALEATASQPRCSTEVRAAGLNSKGNGMARKAGGGRSLVHVQAWPTETFACGPGAPSCSPLT